MGPLKLALFDVDGTLVDSQNAIVGAMGAAFADVGLALPERKKVLRTIGLSLSNAFHLLAPGADAATKIRMEQAYRDAFLSERSRPGAADREPLYPGVAEMLRGLDTAPEVLLGVATGKARRGLSHVLKLHGLEGLFTTLQTPDTNTPKPDPAMALAALGETGVEPRHAVMIGDTEYDISMGRAAGLHTVAVSWGYHDRSALGAADMIIDDVAALPEALNGLWG